MKKSLYLVLLVLIVVACKRDPLPKEALKRDKFIEVLVDIHISESMFRERRGLRLDSLQSSKLYNAVLEKHKVSNEEVMITGLYYSRHQREYDKIYAEVLDRLNIALEDLNEPIPESEETTKEKPDRGEIEK